MRMNQTFYSTIITFLLMSCSSDKQTTDGLPFIDVSGNYPEKEIVLTDIADITYLHLSTTDDDYLYKGQISYITKNTVIVLDQVSKSILFFSKDGVPRSRFNRIGQGPGDYINPTVEGYDEQTDEVFVSDFYRNVILVYSSIGEYKRTITLPQESIISIIIDFDDHSLFCYDNRIATLRDLALLRGGSLSDVSANDYRLPFYRISKTDGEVLDYVELPGADLIMGAYYMGRWLSAPCRFAVKCPEGVLLNNFQNDTVFLYNGDKPLTPVFYQTPSDVSLNPKQYVYQCLDRGQYQFFQVNIMREGVNPLSYPSKYYMRYKETGEIVQYKFISNDYKGKDFIMNRSHRKTDGTLTLDGDPYTDGYWFELDLYELKQADRENRLSGKLKELVSTLNEDEDNSVFMLVEFK